MDQNTFGTGESRNWDATMTAMNMITDINEQIEFASVYEDDQFIARKDLDYPGRSDADILKESLRTEGSEVKTGRATDSRREPGNEIPPFTAPKGYEWTIDYGVSDQMPNLWAFKKAKKEK